MKGKMLKKIGIIGVFTFCFLLQVDLAQGDRRIKLQDIKKSKVPMEIELNFSSVPMLNEPAVLNIEIRVLRDAPNTLIDIELPGDGFSLISGNTQLNEDLSSGSTTLYQLEVLPVELGQYKITATAKSGGSDYIFGKREALYVNIGDGFSELSKTSFKSELAGHRSGAIKIEDVSEPPTHVPPDQKSMEDREPLYFTAPGPGQIAVEGYWFYQDKDGVDQPLRDAKVEIWDSDTSGDILLETTNTDNSGYYVSGNISNNDSEGGGQDIYVKVFATDDRSVRVTDFSSSSNLYYSATEVQNDVSDGEVDLGSYSIDDSDNRMAWYIYDVIANDAFDYLADNVGWRNIYTLQVRWSPTNTSQGTYYRPGGSIDLLAGDRWDSDVFLHEYGHFVMYKIYDNSMPPSPSCYNHYWGSHSSMGCAWTEGWANFLQAAIQNDRFYDDTEDMILHINFEPPTPGADHAEDEGAVAASLWDIFDPASTSESWDAIGNGINGASNNGVWSIVSGDGPTDFIEFYNYWMNSSNAYNPEITAILQHHQIDLDTTRPVVRITAPTTDSTYTASNSRLNIGGTASDDVGLTSVRWTNSRGGSGPCDGMSSWSKTGIELSSGENVITVTARDAAGNSRTDTLTVTYTPPDSTRPAVRITAPTTDSSYTTSNSPLNIRGSASDNVAVTSVSWTNSRGGSGDCSGTSSWRKNGIVLSSGENVITVTARDAAGNSRTDTLTVTYTPPDTTRPAVRITVPTSGTTYTASNSRLNIGGTASDDVGLTSVRWTNSRGGSGPCDGMSSWSKTGIELSSGENVITVTARDAAGNEGTDTLTVIYTPLDAPPEIIEEACYPHDAQGMEDDTLRVPNDTSIVARIKSPHGIDKDSVEMRIEEESVSIRVQAVVDGDNTDFWIIHSPNTLFAFDQTVNFSIDAKSLNGVGMDTYYSSFKVESKEEYDAALAMTPASTEYPDEPAIGQNTVVADPGTAIEGAEIIYGNLEPVAPRFGPVEEISNLDIATPVGLPLNLQPANVFVNPVTVFIPCLGETDLETLKIYVFNPASGWQASLETDGFIVAESRVNHGPNDPDPTEPPTIEVQLNHFSGVQAGKPFLPSAGTEEEQDGGGGGGGGGGGCFISAAAGTSQNLKTDTLVFMFLLSLGVVGCAGIRRVLLK